MKHEVTSLNTKKLLAASLRKQMEKKPFSKITVSEIVKDCGVNRKTFYYHFEDIYALLKWMLEQDAVQVLHGFSLLQDYRDAILFVLDYVEKNQTIINCIYNSVGLDDLRRFFYDDFFDVMDKLIREVEQDAGLTLPKDFRKFLPWQDFCLTSYRVRLLSLIRKWSITCPRFFDFLLPALFRKKEMQSLKAQDSAYSGSFSSSSCMIAGLHRKNSLIFSISSSCTSRRAA